MEREIRELEKDRTNKANEKQKELEKKGLEKKRKREEKNAKEEEERRKYVPLFEFTIDCATQT